MLLLSLAAALAQERETTRSIRGQVLGPDGKPVANALVHLKNRQTGTVLTVVSDKQGRYVIGGVPLGVDFELYAEFGELRSRTKKLSRLDRRTRISLDFDLQKEEKKTAEAESKGLKPSR